MLQSVKSNGFLRCTGKLDDVARLCHRVGPGIALSNAQVFANIWQTYVQIHFRLPNIYRPKNEDEAQGTNLSGTFLSLTWFGHFKRRLNLLLHHSISHSESMEVILPTTICCNLESANHGIRSIFYVSSLVQPSVPCPVETLNFREINFGRILRLSLWIIASHNPGQSSLSEGQFKIFCSAVPQWTPFFHHPILISRSSGVVHFPDPICPIDSFLLLAISKRYETFSKLQVFVKIGQN